MNERRMNCDHYYVQATSNCIIDNQIILEGNFVKTARGNKKYFKTKKAAESFIESTELRTLRVFTIYGTLTKN